MWSSSPLSVTVSLGDVLKQKNLEDELPGKLEKGRDPETSPGGGSPHVLPCCRHGWRDGGSPPPQLLHNCFQLKLCK